MFPLSLGTTINTRCDNAAAIVGPLHSIYLVPYFFTLACSMRDIKLSSTINYQPPHKQWYGGAPSAPPKPKGLPKEDGRHALARAIHSSSFIIQPQPGLSTIDIKG